MRSRFDVEVDPDEERAREVADEAAESLMLEELHADLDEVSRLLEE